MAKSNANDTFNNSDRDNPIDAMKRREQLEQDFDTPFSPPDGVQDRIDDKHPVTDANIDEHEHYDAGIEAASGADMPGEAADEDDQVPLV